MSKQLSIFDSFSIEAYKDQADIVEKTASQIAKDFALFGLPIEFSGNSEWAYNELFNQMCPIIERLIHNDYNRLLSLLYQIDLSPANIKTAHEENPGMPENEMLSQLIIYREFKKVVMRIYFKSKKI